MVRPDSHLSSHSLIKDDLILDSFTKPHPLHPNPLDFLGYPYETTPLKKLPNFDHNNNDHSFSFD